jgi:hypothetical protein
MSVEVRVELPSSLCLLAGVGHQVLVSVDGPVTQRTILDALEAIHPALVGTIRDHTTKRRRAFMRFFACGEDVSFCGMDEAVPEAVADGREAFMVVGAIAGG